MKVLFSIVLCSFCFGVWPLLFRASGKGDITGMLVMMSVALIVVGTCVVYQGAPWPSGNSYAYLVTAGLLLGIGMARFNTLLSDRSIEISTVQPTVSVLLIVFSVIGALWLFSDSFTWQKRAGIILAIGAVVLLRPTPTKVIPPGKPLPRSVVTEAE